MRVVPPVANLQHRAPLHVLALRVPMLHSLHSLHSLPLHRLGQLGLLGLLGFAPFATPAAAQSAVSNHPIAIAEPDVALLFGVAIGTLALARYFGRKPRR